MINITEGHIHQRTVQFSGQMVEHFATITHDHALVHFDTSFAEKMGYKGCIVHGFLVASIYSEMLGCHLPGCDSVIQKIETNFHLPVYVGEKIHYTVTVTRISEAAGAVVLALEAKNSAGEVVNKGKATCIIKQPT